MADGSAMLLWDDWGWRVQEMVRFEVEFPSLRPRSTVSLTFVIGATGKATGHGSVR
jgi:hypothetical protein